MIRSLNYYATTESFSFKSQEHGYFSKQNQFYSLAKTETK